MNKNKAKKCLYNKYKRVLSLYSKQSLIDTELGLDYFIIYLKYLRDMRIMDKIDGGLEEDNLITTISSALNAYEEYVGCIHKYYDVTDTSITPKDKTLSAEEVLKQYNKNKIEANDIFWEIVKTNLESWIF